MGDLYLVHSNFLKDDDNYLVHHGILGQKWGVRRYQNPDGTFTVNEAGKAVDPEHPQFPERWLRAVAKDCGDVIEVKTK